MAVKKKNTKGSKPIKSRLEKLSCTVLLVEDNLINQKVTMSMLKNMNCQVHISNHGLEALVAIKEQRYDLILMDCHMPEMDGYTATTHILAYEKQEGCPHTPIVALTANSLQGDLEKCLEAGMDDYLSKPLSMKKLENIILKWLATHENK